MTKLMRAKLPGIAVACLLVASLVVAGATAPATTAALAPTVSIVPGTQEVAAGGTFSVDVLVDSAGTPITACNVTVTFDADLTVTGLTGADLLGAFGLDALYLPAIDVGEVSYGGVRIGDPIVPIAVEGNFVTIDFDVDAAAAGTYPLVVAATLKDAAGDPVPGVILNDSEVVVPGEVPGEASVSIMPATQTVAAGGTFSVDVVVDSAGTPITACNVVVTFDADLTATGLTGADLLGTFGIDALYIPGIDVGEVSYGGVRTDGPIAVDGDFVTIDFEVDAAAAGTYDLSVEATLRDAAGDPIAVVENDGEVVVPAVGAPSVSIDPATQMVEAGSSFSVDVVVDSVGTPITACNVVVTFDADLTATGLTEPDLLGTFGIDALYMPTIDVGEVSYGGVRIDGPIAVNGNFVTIDFDVDPAAVEGTVYALAIDATLRDAAGDPIAVVENDGEIVIGVPGPVVFEETFVGTLAEGLRAYICTIPEGATELAIDLSTAASPGPDLDLELWDGATKVIGEFGVIDSAPDGTYDGDYFRYSGYDGGEEEITADGPLSRPYDLKVYAYQAGTYTVDVYYVIPPGVDVTPPEITITAPDGTVGELVTITVTATDPSGVAYIGFGVWPDDYVLTGTLADWNEAIAMASGPGGEVSLTFTPSSANSYYVAAWAGDMVGNSTPDLAPETVDWEVT